MLSSRRPCQAIERIVGVVGRGIDPPVVEIDNVVDIRVVAEPRDVPDRVVRVGERLYGARLRIGVRARRREGRDAERLRIVRVAGDASVAQGDLGMLPGAL